MDLARAVFCTDGLFVQSIEQIPLVSNAVRNVHRHHGNKYAEERARRANPLGMNGTLTKVLEHVPIASNAIENLHLLSGNTEAADRARSANLGRVLRAEITNFGAEITNCAGSRQKMEAQFSARPAVRRSAQAALQQTEKRQLESASKISPPNVQVVDTASEQVETRTPTDSETPVVAPPQSESMKSVDSVDGEWILVK